MSVDSWPMVIINTTNKVIRPGERILVISALYQSFTCYNSNIIEREVLMKAKNSTAIILVLIIAGLLGFFISQFTSPLSDHEIFGRAEVGIISQQNVELKIRMDTGAQTSSLSAHDIEVFDKGAQQWVRFIIEPERTGDKIYQFEMPLKREVRIRKRSAEVACSPEDTDDDCHLFERRPVVEMQICLGNKTQFIEVSLADRSNFTYPMLLGRSAMESFGVLIDPAVEYTTPPDCNGSESDEL